jgi:hypothetical protein
MKDTIVRQNCIVPKPESVLDRSQLLSPEILKERVEIKRSAEFSTLSAVQTEMQTMRKGFIIPKTK